MTTVAEAITRSRLSRKDIDNLVQLGHLSPARKDGRRQFSPADMVKLILCGELKGIIPPSVACDMAEAIPEFIEAHPRAKRIVLWRTDGDAPWMLDEVAPVDHIALSVDAALFRA